MSEQPLTKKHKREECINYEEINLDDYLNIDLDKYKKYLYSKQRDYEEKIVIIKELIKSTNSKIAQKCKEKNNGHQWIREREDCMYGSRFTVCKNCRVDYYDNTWIHY